MTALEPEPYHCRLSSSDPAYDEIERRHRAAVESGVDSYLDPKSGLRVFTTAHHLERGVCCESLCRHCPFGFTNVAP